MKKPAHRHELAHPGLGADALAAIKAENAALVAERAGNGLADCDRAVFGRVVLIDVEIALDVAGDVDQRVAAELLDHVIEKADPG